MTLQEKIAAFDAASRKILVVGGGFAGTVATRYVAERMGRNLEQVLLVESQPTPGYRTKCGERVSRSTRAHIETQSN